jgi:hypothetical protein
VKAAARQRKWKVKSEKEKGKRQEEDMLCQL